jgi:hypothetical protein
MGLVTMRYKALSLGIFLFIILAFILFVDSKRDNKRGDISIKTKEPVKKYLLG